MHRITESTRCGVITKRGLTIEISVFVVYLASRTVLYTDDPRGINTNFNCGNYHTLDQDSTSSSFPIARVREMGK